MSRSFLLVADDYGLSPAVSAGIRELLTARRLSGTGCMTLFPEWADEAARLRAADLPGKAQIGLHLTLTDFPGLTGWSLDGAGHMPRLGRLLAAVATTRRHDAAIAVELDAQLAAFEAEWGRPPDYLDGHQHVHFLRPVRRWLLARAGHFTRSSARPWLRGAPAAGLGSGTALKAKIAFVSALARGFDLSMRNAGYVVKGPLCGFYDWRKPDAFPAALDAWVARAPDGALIMCHPGGIDDRLRARDVLVEARRIELEALLTRPRLPLPEVSA